MEMMNELSALAANCATYEEFYSTVRRNFSPEEIDSLNLEAIWEEALDVEITEIEWLEMESSYQKWKDSRHGY